MVAPLARGELPVQINTNSSQNISPSLLGVALLPQRGMGLHGRGVRDHAHLSAASDTAPLADETGCDQGTVSPLPKNGDRKKIIGA